MKNKDERLYAQQHNISKFIAICPTHEESVFYTSSGRCVKCAAEAKDPIIQQKYWKQNKDKVNKQRRDKYNAAKQQRNI